MLAGAVYEFTIGSTVARNHIIVTSVSIKQDSEAVSTFTKENTAERNQFTVSCVSIKRESGVA